jgi:hypothetical protein
MGLDGSHLPCPYGGVTWACPCTHTAVARLTLPRVPLDRGFGLSPLPQTQKAGSSDSWLTGGGGTPTVEIAWQCFRKVSLTYSMHGV